MGDPSASPGTQLPCISEVPPPPPPLAMYETDGVSPRDAHSILTSLLTTNSCGARYFIFYNASVFSLLNTPAESTCSTASQMPLRKASSTLATNSTPTGAPARPGPLSRGVTWPRTGSGPGQTGAVFKCSFTFVTLHQLPAHPIEGKKNELHDLPALQLLLSDARWRGVIRWQRSKDTKLIIMSIWSCSSDALLRAVSEIKAEIRGDWDITGHANDSTSVRKDTFYHCLWKNAGTAPGHPAFIGHARGRPIPEDHQKHWSRHLTSRIRRAATL